MIHPILPLVRWLITACAAALIYIAVFLYEDQQGQIHNRLLALWVGIDDIRIQVLFKQSILLNRAFGLVNDGFNALLGQHLRSLRAVAVTICYSFASFIAEIIWTGSHNQGDYFTPDFFYDPHAIVKGLPFLAALLVLGSSFIGIKKKKTELAWAACTVVLGPLLFACYFMWASPFAPENFDDVTVKWRSLGVGVVLLIVLSCIAVLCDLCFIMINRKLVRLAITPARNNSQEWRTRGSTIRMIIIFLCNISLGIAYIAPLLFKNLAPRGDVGEFVIAIAATNLITSFSAFLIVFVLAISLLTRLIWPFVERPIYAIYRFDLVKKPRLLLSLAFSLLTWTIPGWKVFWDAMKKL